MNVPVLVDRSWYLEEAAMGRDPLRSLALIAESRDVATCGLICAELGRRVGEERFLERLQAAWEAMLYVASDQVRWDKTMALGRLLSRRGIEIPLAELHIASCALSIGAVVLTYETLFQKIPGLAATDRLY